AGFARAADSWGRLRTGLPRPPPTERRRWALTIALARLGGHLSLHARIHVAHDPRELGAAVGGVVLDSGLPGEVALGAVGLAPLGVLVDPLEVLERVARAEGVGADVLVAREAHVDEREAVA